MSNFQERLAAAPIPSDTTVYNQTHQLGLVFDRHKDRTDAAAILPAIPDESLVFLEKCSYDESQVNKGSVMLGRRFKTPLGRATGLLVRMQNKSLALRELYESNPSRYRRYKGKINSAVDKSEQTKGNKNNQHLSFSSELFFGLIEKGCLYTPGDANSAQLSREEAMEVLGMRRKAETPAEPLEDPSEAYRKLQNATNHINGMHLFRDYALIKNMISLDESGYRQMLGYGTDEVLPAVVIRGRAHSNSVTHILNLAGVNFTVLRDTTPETDEVKIGTNFDSDPEIDKSVQRSAYYHLRERVHMNGPAAYEVIRDTLDLAATPEGAVDFLKLGTKNPKAFASMDGLLRAAAKYQALAELRNEILAEHA